jgi:hypothetical protein
MNTAELGKLLSEKIWSIVIILVLLRVVVVGYSFPSPGETDVQMLEKRKGIRDEGYISKFERSNIGTNERAQATSVVVFENNRS